MKRTMLVYKKRQSNLHNIDNWYVRAFSAFRGQYLFFIFQQE